MANHYRILWFDSEVRQNNYPNSKSISNKFEISNRQAQRDIEYLKSLGAPLFYSYQQNGYVYSHNNFIVPNTFLSSTDKDFLRFLALKYSQFDNTKQNQELAQSLSKLVEKDDVKREYLFFNLDAKQYDIYHCLIMGIQRKNKVNLTLLNTMVSLFHPYKLMNRFGNDYIEGFDETQNKVTLVRVGNISKVKVLNQSFEVKDTIELSSYTGGVSPFTAKIKVNSKFHYDSDYRLLIKKYQKDSIIIEFYKQEEIISFLINNEYWEEILSPKWLIKLLKERMNKVLTKL